MINIKSMPTTIEDLLKEIADEIGPGTLPKKVSIEFSDFFTTE